MAAPLSPTPSAALNFSTPSNSLRHESYEVGSYSINSFDDDNNLSEGDSSPFLSHVKEDVASPAATSTTTTGSTPRGPSPPKARPGSRIMSGSELSPLKLLHSHQQAQIQTQISQSQQQQSPRQSFSSTGTSMPPPPLPQSPRKAPIVKRFPVRVSGQESPRRLSNEQQQQQRRASDESNPHSRSNSQPRPPLTLQDAVRDNHNLKHAIEIFEDDDFSTPHDDDIMDTDGDHEMNHDSARPNDRHDESMEDDYDRTNPDDTLASTFSTFSAVPNLTMLANMRSDSPTKYSSSNFRESTSSRTPRGPVPDRSGTHQLYDSGGSTGGGNNTLNLMDFTEQVRYGGYESKPTPSRRMNGVNGSGRNGSNAVGATPQRGGGNNLLDFDIPPMPTPRSIPTITPRELESLKSGFLSEISSLKASLSGKEAEVLSLKTAVGDAEKRVGECMEQLREIQDVHDSLVTEKDSWERRGREMESVLRKVKEEIVLGQREREELEFKLHEAEQRREAAEMMAQDAESKMAGMRAGKASAEAAATSPTNVIGSNKEVEMAVERVARELHALYKSKHETKVAALKKSYESRWEKKVANLQAQLDELAQENEELRHGRDSASRVDPQRLHELEEERKAERAQNAAHIRELEAESQKLEAILRTVQADNDDLRVLLERERVEKGELVQLAEEMMNMQNSILASAPEEQPEPEPEPAPRPAPQPMRISPPPQPQQVTVTKTPNRRLSSSYGAGSKTPMSVRQSMPPPPSTEAGAGGNNFRMSVGPGGFRASGLRAPGSGLKGSAESRMGLGRGAAAHERARSIPSAGGPRPGSGQGTSSRMGIMSSIEKMGSGIGGGSSSGYGQYRRGD
ncbi:hypothetical protein QBC35DRAFT_426600 [Podospora australis]|uniref:Uncharacterized protein n=1 Tax=Podospora australis TaxID=1536484 RepID=A0AAN6X4I1_9PEZI|nr:hypothetical protein QBC35DRAFT_426600 [Podospora australis]